MSFTNPREITDDHLKYFYQEVLLPEYDEDKKDAVDIGQGESYDLPELDYKRKTLRPDSSFERGDRKWKPSQMFLGQNDAEAFRKYDKKYKKANVEKRREAVKEVPNLQFSLQEVKLVKPKHQRTLYYSF